VLSTVMCSYCPVCDQFVKNLDVCSESEYHRDDYYDYYETEPEPEYTFHLDEKLSSDAIWYDGKVRTRSESSSHRYTTVITEVKKIIDKIEVTKGKPEKVRLFEIVLLIFKENKWILKNKKLADIIIVKIDEFASDSPEFKYLASFKYQLFG